MREKGDLLRDTILSAEEMQVWDLESCGLANPT